MSVFCHISMRSFSIHFQERLEYDAVVFTNPVFASETETNRNRFCLKHSNSQSWLFPIVKPWQTASPGDKITTNVILLNTLKYACKEGKVALHAGKNFNHQ